MKDELHDAVAIDLGAGVEETQGGGPRQQSDGLELTRENMGYSQD